MNRELLETIYDPCIRIRTDSPNSRRVKRGGRICTAVETFYARKYGTIVAEAFGYDADNREQMKIIIRFGSKLQNLLYELAPASQDQFMARRAACDAELDKVYPKTSIIPDDEMAKYNKQFTDKARVDGMFPSVETFRQALDTVIAEMGLT